MYSMISSDPPFLTHPHQKFGGSGANFLSSIIVVEELARIDPSVSVMVDVQNTLVNTGIIKWGTPQQHEKYLTRLSSV